MPELLPTFMQLLKDTLLPTNTFGFPELFHPVRQGNTFHLYYIYNKLVLFVFRPKTFDSRLPL